MSENKKNIKKTLFSVTGLVVIFGILVLANAIFARVNLRFDATEDNLYSLSNGTKEIIKNLEEDVTIKVFYSRSLANIPAHLNIYANRVIDFLSEYERYGNGKITVEIIDPKPDSEAEEWAQKFGIRGLNFPTGDTLYMGLVAIAADQEETIAFLDPAGEQRLEYDLTRIISRVQAPKNQKIGIISTLPVFGTPQPMGFNMPQPPQMEPWLFVTELRETYDVVEIAGNEEAIPDDINLLLVIHPKNISPALQYAIDQYVLKGGNALIMVDPFCTRDMSQDRMKSSSLPKLFSAWGVSFDAAKTVVDFDHATRLRTQNNQVEANPAWLSVRNDSFNSDAIVTSELESLLFPMVGAVKKQADSKYDYEPLVQSSANSSLEDAFRLQFGMESIRRSFKPTLDKYDLAVRIRGTFKTAFPAGKPASDNPDEQQDSPASDQEGLKEGQKASTVIIVADTDLLYDDYYVSKQNFLGMDLTRMFNDNLNFFLNSAEMLAGGEALISIRSRGTFERPFTRVQMLEKKAQDQWRDREQELVAKVEETNRKLQELQAQKDSSQRLIMSQEQEEEIRKFQEEKQRINRELKLVRRHLRADIEALGTKVKFINIFLMPILVSIAGIGYALYKRKKSLEN